MKKDKKIVASRLFKLLYIKLYRSNTSPHRIAIGLGLGVFLGIMPGTGIIAALILASVFRLNRASALLGTLITNTWLSFATFLLSIKIGSVIMGLRWQDVYHSAKDIFKNFHWADLFKISVFKIVLPLALGYFVVSVCLGLITYVISLLAIRYFRSRRKKKCVGA